jgi:hypothetical protein
MQQKKVVGVKEILSPEILSPVLSLSWERAA